MGEALLGGPEAELGVGDPQDLLWEPGVRSGTLLESPPTDFLAVFFRITGPVEAALPFLDLTPLGIGDVEGSSRQFG